MYILRGASLSGIFLRIDGVPPAQNTHPSGPLSLPKVRTDCLITICTMSTDVDYGDYYVGLVLPGGATAQSPIPESYTSCLSWPGLALL